MVGIVGSGFFRYGLKGRVLGTVFTFIFMILMNFRSRRFRFWVFFCNMIIDRILRGLSGGVVELISFFVGFRVGLVELCVDVSVVWLGVYIR